jgi:ankyrin repeat protein
MLLGVGADGNLPNKHLQTPMHIVCMCDVPTEIIDALLAAGCSPNVLDSEVRLVDCIGHGASERANEEHP